jgi:cytochrome P450
MIQTAHFLELTSIIVAVYLARWVYEIWSLRSRTSKAVRQYGCQPGSRYPNLDPFLGYDLFRILARATKEGRRTKLFADLHRRYGDTFQFQALLSKRISTISPKNFQAITTTNFSDFGVAPMRNGSILKLLGSGVFTRDGEAWKRARAIIRPTFNRAEIADLENFETHVARLLALIPRDGSTVDLQPLFKRLVRTFCYG